MIRLIAALCLLGTAGGALADTDFLKVSVGKASVILKPGEIVSAERSLAFGPRVVEVVVISDFDFIFEGLTRGQIGVEFVVTLCGEDVSRARVTKKLTKAEFMFDAGSVASADQALARLTSGSCSAIEL